MTRDEFKRRLASSTSISGWVEDFMVRLVVMMKEFGVGTPSFFLDMPASTFEETWDCLVRIKKMENDAVKRSHDGRPARLGYG